MAALHARENVEVALNLGGVRGGAARERATTLLNELGLQARQQFGVDQLSGGEKQRVAIARAIANRPAPILADEPTAKVADRVLWLEDGRLKALAALVRDPVCGMLLDPQQAPCAARGRSGSLVRRGTPIGYRHGDEGGPNAD